MPDPDIRQKILDFVLEQTQKVAPHFPDASETGLSDRMINNVRLKYNSIKEYYGTACGELAAYTLGINQAALDLSSTIPVFMGVALVPTGNDNGHSYPLGEVCLAISNRNGMLRRNGRPGNSLTVNADCLRLPTEEEITEFLDELSEEGWNDLINCWSDVL